MERFITFVRYVQRTTHKIAYLDGIRGVAALLVFFHHFFLVFYTAYFTWDPGATHMHGWDIKYGKSVFSVVTNGNFCVCVFFVLSGFVLSCKYFNDNKIATLVSAAQRRFIRLYIPVAFTLILSYLLIKAHAYLNIPVSHITHSEWWFGNMWTFEHPTKALWHCLVSDTMFGGDASFDTSMWTMSIEFYNSFIVFAFLALTIGVRKRYLMLIIMMIFCYITKNTCLGAFMLGISLNYVELNKIHLAKRRESFLAITLLLIGLIMGSFPSNNIPGSTIFAFTVPRFDDFANMWCHTIGAFLTVLSFVLSPRLQRIISLRFFRFLGYISFSIYLLHPLVMGTFSSYLFLKIYRHMHYYQAVLVVLGATTFVCFLFSWLMTRYIDDKGVLLSKYIYNKYVKKETLQIE